MQSEEQVDDAILVHTPGSQAKQPDQLTPSEQPVLLSDDIENDFVNLDLKRELLGTDSNEHYRTAFFESGDKSLRHFSGDIQDEEASESIAYRSSPNKLRQNYEEETKHLGLFVSSKKEPI